MTNINLDEDDDLLDWDFVAGPDPERPSGTIEVNLEYIGKLEPKNYMDQ